MAIYKFSKMFGNAVTISMIKRRLHNQTFPNLSIMSGIGGTGKSTSAGLIGLSLTCEKPVFGEACLKCETCLRNIRGLESNGEGVSLFSTNLPIKTKDADFKEVIRQVFNMRNAAGKTVHIFGEVHGLDKNKQLQLNEEFDRLDENTYVIMTTTNPERLLAELRSRATPIYNFYRLKRKEMDLLYDSLGNDFGVSTKDNEVREILLRSAKGIPRDLSKLLEFTRDTSPTIEELRDFLEYINNYSFITIFDSMTSNFGVMVELVDDLLSRHTLRSLVERMKEFLADVHTYFGAESSSVFDDEERKEISRIFSGVDVLKMANSLSRLDLSEATTSDLRLLFFNYRQIINKESPTSVFTGDSARAVAQNYRADATFKEEQTLQEDKPTVKGKPLDVGMLRDLENINKSNSF